MSSLHPFRRHILIAIGTAMFSSVMYGGQDFRDSTLTPAARAESLLQQMTLEEKIGQMMQVDLTPTLSHLSDLARYGFGSVLSGGDSDPPGGNTPDIWRGVHDSLQRIALSSRLRIPILYGIDAVHGHSNVVGATIFPHNIGLGCTRNPTLIELAARVTAIEMAATGIRWNFAPMIGVPRDERWGRTYEGFGETPELASLGAVQVRGLQGSTLKDRTSVLACAKHFLADGGTDGGKDQGNATLATATIRSIHLPGYKAALGYHTGSVMVSYSSINGGKMHGNRYWLTDVLKGELRFTGIVVSDWGGIDQLGPDYTKDVEQSVNAGIDMVMLPSRYMDFLNAMQELVRQGRVSSARIDDAVRRILTAKFSLGLFEHPFADPALLSEVGSPAHRAVARQCVRESMVLLKNERHALPLPAHATRILVAGTHADNIGFQCGGWTIRWQGGNGATTPGTTILEGMRQAAPTTAIDYRESGDFEDTSADACVVVIGERPYAEGSGDSKDLSLSPADMALVRKMKSYGHPLVVVLVAGRPLILGEILDSVDAIVAAWLPGTEGGGVADLLFSVVPPKGVLAHSWPRTVKQIPINVGDPDYDPLFPYGFGLSSF